MSVRGLSSSSEKAYRKQTEILRALSEHGEPIGSSVIQKRLERRGFFLTGIQVETFAPYCLVDLKDMQGDLDKLIL